MNDGKPKEVKKLTQDLNPKSTKNVAFMRRHDISLQDFKRGLKSYEAQYG